MEQDKRIQAHFDDEIFLYENDVYYYRGSPPGLKRRVEKSLRLKRGATQKEILKAKKELLDSLDNLGTNTSNITTAKIFDRYVAHRKDESLNPENLSQSTFDETKNLIENHFKPWFQSIKLETFDQLLLDDYFEFKFKKGLNLKNHRKVINHFLKWCVNNKYLKFRPEIELQKKFTKQKRQRVILSDDQVKAILKNANDKLTLYICMYLFMGMRNSEICNLKWSEIDFKKRSLQVNPLSNRRRKSRVIPINSNVIEMLKVRQSKSNSDFVFPNAIDKSKPMHKSSIRAPWKALLKRSNVDLGLTPHDLRATFETHMHKNTNFTDTQREKMAGAAIDVQKNIYITMDAEALRGLENSVQISGLDKVLKNKLGERVGEKQKSKKAKRS
jgi:hypothetical protein